MAKRIITALDVGSSKVCAIIASVEESGAPTVIGVAATSGRGIKKGEIVNIDEAINSIATALEAAERMAGITVSSVYVSITGKHITSTNNKGVVAISQEEITAEDVFRAMESARTVSIPLSREILHVMPREFIVDSQTGIKDPIGMTGTRLEVDAHIVSATSTALHNLIKCVQQLGLRVEDVVFNGWASATSVLTDTEKELGVLLLDIGGGTTSITTFVEDAITYSGAIPFGGINVTSDLAIGLRTSLEDADRIKVLLGEFTKKKKLPGVKTPALLQKNQEDTKKKKKEMLDISSLKIDGLDEVDKGLVNEIIEARLSEIFDLVIEQVEQSGNEVRLPAGVVITGGSALLPNITKVAKKVFGLPARVGHPSGLQGLVDEISTPAFAASQGLILYGTEDDSGGRNRATIGTKDSGGPLKAISGWIKNLLP